MTQQTPRAVVFDLDGTLTESKQRLTEEMGVLLGKLLEHFIVAVMSGAGFTQFTTQFLEHLPADTHFKNLYLFPDNAAQCYTYDSGAWQPQYDHAFSSEEKEHITLALYQALDAVGLRDVPLRIWGEQLEDRGAQESFSPLGQGAPLSEKQAWHAAHTDLREQLRRKLAEYLPDFAVATGGLTTIDITRKDITKAYGIGELSRLSSIPIPQMLYVGDALEPGGNDAVVKETGVPTRAVTGPLETRQVIEMLLGS